MKKLTVKEQGASAAFGLLMGTLCLLGGVSFVFLFPSIWGLLAICVYWLYGAVFFAYSIDTYRKHKQCSEFIAEYKGVFSAVVLALWLCIGIGILAL